MKQIVSFLVVGGTGFVVDAGVLVGLLHFTPLDPFTARVLAIGAALMTTWQLNRNFTFTRSERHVAVEGLRYGGVGVVSALLNYLVYSALLMVFADLRPVIALTIGSASGLLLSYNGYSRLVFGRG